MIEFESDIARRVSYSKMFNRISLKRLVRYTSSINLQTAVSTTTVLRKLFYRFICYPLLPILITRKYPSKLSD